VGSVPLLITEILADMTEEEEQNRRIQHPRRIQSRKDQNNKATMEPRPNRNHIRIPTDQKGRTLTTIKKGI